MEKLIAHRGLKISNVKENSIESFKKAIENKQYVGFECDIRTTKDQIFVINHNPLIGKDIISLSNYKDLRKKYRLPTLEEVLKLNTKKIMLLEIKEANINTESLKELLKKYQNKNIYIMSFHNNVIKKMQQNSRSYQLGVLNYVLNSEESYEGYDFICLLENIASKKLVNFFESKQINVFFYGIHHLNSLSKQYNDCYFITDEVKY